MPTTGSRRPSTTRGIWARRRARSRGGVLGRQARPFAHVNYLYGDDVSTNLDLRPEKRELALSIVRAVREAVGPDALMMIETHAMLNFKTAVEMAHAMAPYGVTWFEEPVGPENVEVLEAFRRRIPNEVPICVGERHYTRNGFRPLFERHICDVVHAGCNPVRRAVGAQANRHDGGGLFGHDRPA